MCPLLLVHTGFGAIIAAEPMGIIGGLAQVRVGDLFGTRIYEATQT